MERPHVLMELQQKCWCGDIVTNWMVMYVKWHGRGGRCQKTGQKPSLFQFTRGRAGEGSMGAIEVKV